jgi:hypothetical protein
MSIPDDPLPAHWQYYSDRAAENDGGYADAFGQGREEQLHETLVFIESGEPFTDEVRDRLDRIPHNRTKKHRRLLKLLKGRLRGEEPGYTAWPDDEDAQLLDQVHEMLAPAEWEVECRLACGETYVEVAAGGVARATLKMRVFRWRARVREAVAV